MCAPGLEPWLADELMALGVRSPATVEGGVEFSGDARLLYRVCLASGLATAVRVRMAQFVARRFAQIVDGVASLPWADWIAPEVPIEIKVTCRKSRLYHSKAVAERVREGMRNALGFASPPAGDEPGLVVHVRLLQDNCTLSLDVTGAPLYRRGYRLATGKAPLRPDLARALLVVSGWQPDTPLIDLFCGAGTVCIEAAAMAQRLAPGRHRSFAFGQAPTFEPRVWADVQAAAMDGVRPMPALVWGSDRDAGAIAAAQQNANRAGVKVRFDASPLGRSPALDADLNAVGVWASNPPYGRRTGDASRLLNLYQSIGVQRRRLPEAWRLAMVVADPQMARATGIEMQSVVMTDHGGSKVRLMVESPPKP